MDSVGFAGETSQLTYRRKQESSQEGRMAGTVMNDPTAPGTRDCARDPAPNEPSATARRALLTPAGKHTFRVLVGVGTCACALFFSLAGSPASAVAATPCWKTLMNEWYGGRIAHVYPIACYQGAIVHLPTDVQVYSSARDDIERALALALAHQKNPKVPAATIASSSPAPTGLGGGSSGTSAPSKQTPREPILSAIKNSASGGATSFPLPLLILGGLALFFLAAGAVGLIIRRMHGGGPRA